MRSDVIFVATQRLLIAPCFMKSNLWGNSSERQTNSRWCLSVSRKKPTDPLLPKPIIIPRLFKMSVIKELKKKRLLRAASRPVAAFSKMSFQHHKCHGRLKDRHCLKPTAVHGEMEEGRADEALRDDDDDDELHGVPVKRYGVVVTVTFKRHLGSRCETQARA